MEKANQRIRQTIETSEGNPPSGRMCSTCKHGDTNLAEHPCCECDRGCSKWEAAI